MIFYSWESEYNSTTFYNVVGLLFNHYIIPIRKALDTFFLLSKYIVAQHQVIWLFFFVKQTNSS